MKRRHFIKTLTTSTLSVSLGFPNIIRSNDIPLKIGYIPITDATPLLIAHAKGYFQDEGLKVEKPKLIRTWSSLVESFLAGKFNLTHLLFPIPIWMRYKNQNPVKIITWNHLNGSALTVGQKSQISSFSQLGGKIIAVPYWYSMHNILLQMALKKYQLKPVIKKQGSTIKNNETLLVLMPPPDMPSALAAKKIDGYIVAEPFNALAEIKLNAKILRFSGDIWKNHPCCVAVMPDNLIHSHPVFTQKVTNALVRAQQWISNNRKLTAKILSRDGNQYLPVDEKSLLKVFNDYTYPYYNQPNEPQPIIHPKWNINRIGFQPYPYPSATKEILNQFKQTLVEGDNTFLKKLDPGYVAADLVDDQFARKAINLMGGPLSFDEIDLESPWEREEIIEI